MTIEERAAQLATHRVYYNDSEHIYIAPAEESMYIGVLKEQQDIDIQRAWDYIESAFKYNTDTGKIMFDKEKLIQAMKGEEK